MSRIPDEASSVSFASESWQLICQCFEREKIDSTSNRVYGGRLPNIVRI